MAQKEYGLIIPKQKQKHRPIVAKSIFDEEDEDDDDAPRDLLPKPQKPQPSVEKKVSVSSSSSLASTSSTLKKQTKLDLEKALREDPNVFEYDNVYEDMKREKQAEKSKEKVERKSLYIESLLKTAENRKKEQERRSEKKIQMEREKEGDEFKDKEAFVTTAYKEKLLEMKEEEERDKKEKQIDEYLDVKKQKDLSGFYRHLLKQTVGEEKLAEQMRDFESSSVRNPAQERVTEREDSTEATKISKFQSRAGSKKDQKNIRTRRESSDSESEAQSTEDQENKGSENKPLNVEIIREPGSTLVEKDAEETLNKTKVSSSRALNEEVDTGVTTVAIVPVDESSVVKEENEPTEEPKKEQRVKVDRRALLLEKFTKRTVGDVYELAKQRYADRKQARLAFRKLK